MAWLGNSLLKGHKDKSWRAYEAMLAASQQPTVLQLIPSSPHYPASSCPGQLPTQDTTPYKHKETPYEALLDAHIVHTTTTYALDADQNPD